MAPHPLRVVSAGWREQEFLSSVPGFLSFVVHEVLNAEEQCDNTHKVFCDLLAELIKFNKVRILLPSFSGVFGGQHLMLALMFTHGTSSCLEI